MEFIAIWIISGIVSFLITIVVMNDDSESVKHRLNLTELLACIFFGSIFGLLATASFIVVAIVSGFSNGGIIRKYFDNVIILKKQ